MDDTDAKNPNILNRSDSEIARKTSPNLINEGILAGQKIARISVITLIGIGIIELIMGHFSGSVVATADGIDSLSDAMISFIVLLGLRIAHRPADKKFHFGYHKVESFAAMMAAIGMRIIANKYDLLSLKTDAKNSIKDGSASVIGFFSVLIASQFGFLQMDAIGGMIIAGYIFSVSYISLKQSSLILVDSWQNPKLTDMVKRIVEEKFKEENIRVKSVLLRPAGALAQAEVHLEIDGNKRLADVELLLVMIEMSIRSQIPAIARISSIPHSYPQQKSETARKFGGIFGDRKNQAGSVGHK